MDWCRADMQYVGEMVWNREWDGCGASKYVAHTFAVSRASTGAPAVQFCHYIVRYTCPYLFYIGVLQTSIYKRLIVLAATR